MRTRLLLVLLLLCTAWSGRAGLAHAAPYLPPAGTVWQGVTAGSSVDDFQARTGRHPAVWQRFIAWGGSYAYALQDAAAAHTRLMLHIGTAAGQDMPERYSPGALARGAGDGWLLALGRDLAATGRPVYVRLMAEMNNCHNAYAAYDCAGRRRNAAHGRRAFEWAWKRTVVILRGGALTDVDARLRGLGLPPVRGAAPDTLAAPQVAFVWAPMTGGSPDIAALRPAAYWPGRQWVDWVGTSFYSKFPNWTGLERFYRTFAAGRHAPFAIAEWAMWGADDAGFARTLYRWVASHPLVRMVQYNQGSLLDGPFALRRYPQATRVIRDALRSSRYGS